MKKKFSRPILLVFLLFTGFVFSQPPPPFDDDVNDEPVPIDSYIALLCVVAIVFAYYYIKKNNFLKTVAKKDSLKQ